MLTEGQLSNGNWELNGNQSELYLFHYVKIKSFSKSVAKYGGQFQANSTSYFMKKEIITFSPKQNGALSHSRSTSKEAVPHKQELCVH